MYAEKKVSAVFVFIAVMGLYPFFTVNAQEEMPRESSELDIEATPLPPGVLTPWTRYGDDYVEGLVDALIPVYYENGLLIFTNLRGAYSDVSEQELNLGIGIRKQLNNREAIFGANAYYDSRWTEQDNQFNQFAVGVEMLSTWVDARANAYIPEDTKELLGTEQETSLTGSSTRTSVNGFAQGNTIFEQTVQQKTSTFTTNTFSFYEVPLEGYDAEIGFKLPLPAENVEVRLFGGYYNFEPVWTGNVQSTNDIDGFKGRVEVRIHDKFLIDAEVFEDDRLFGSDYLVSARVRLPFDLSAIGRGENPFRSVPEPSTAFGSRLTEMVMRDPHVQIRSETEVSTTTFSETSSNRSLNVLLEDVIFVDGDNLGDPNENGTFENPFDLIEEGVEKSAATDQRNVFVDGADANYEENVVVREDINLYGAGTFFGSGTNPGDGRIPVWQPAGEGFFILSLEGVNNALVKGFTFDGSGGQPGLGGILVADSRNVTISENTFRHLPIGVGALYEGTLAGSRFNVNIQDNVFEDNLLAVGGGFFTPGTFRVSNNQMRNNLIGVLAASVYTPEFTDVVISNNNIVSNGTTDIFEIQGVKDLVDVFLGPLPPDAELPLPMIGGIVVATLNGNMNADIRNNTVDGALLGITALNLNLGGPDNKMNLNITGNDVRGGGIIELGELLFGGPIDVPFDAGLAGISVLSIGDGAKINDANISGNRIQDTLLGLNIVAAEDGRIARAQVQNNTLTDNLLGITAIGLFDGILNKLNISHNVVDGGGTKVLASVLEDFLGPIPFEIPDFTLGGITVVGIDTDKMLDITIDNNLVKDHVLGISALGFGNVEMGDLRITNNTLEDNFLGVLVYGNGSDVEMRDAHIIGNTISGSGTQFIVDLAGPLFSLPPGTTVPDFGLAGVAVVSVDDARLNRFRVQDNVISDQLVGVIGAALLDGKINNGVISGNTIDYGVLGIGAGGFFDGDAQNITITGNTLNGFGMDIMGGTSLGIFDLFTDKASVGIGVFGVDGRAENSTITGNTVNNNEMGILILENGTGSSSGSTVNTNTFNFNTDNEVTEP